MFRCPVCTGPLTVEPARYHCTSGHSFDRARDGSVNLLAGPSARHRPAGDNAEMIAARAKFLAAGHYDRLRDAVLREITRTSTVLDVGCGEGHYTHPLAADDDVWRGGIDLSKAAISRAARRTKAMAYAVAPAHALPVADDSIDDAIVVFGPMFADELRRVAGTATVVVPGPSHLAELKRLLFDGAEEHPFEPPAALVALGTPDIERITYEIDLAGDDVANLWTMTPYRWQVARDREVVLPATATVTADFLVCRYALR